VDDKNAKYLALTTVHQSLIDGLYGQLRFKYQANRYFSEDDKKKVNRIIDMMAWDIAGQADKVMKEIEEVNRNDV
jgi:hypothetical protein